MQNPIRNAKHNKKKTTMPHNQIAHPAHLYSILIAGPSSLNSANDAFLALALLSSPSSPASFVQIHVEAYIFTLTSD